ncbi:MAG TPA: hypothetical protein VGQ36_13320 [Thermoanaerobaculia bacterium]|jgi:dienelactone hydrolase|nr:hypothetical protein [Thermoanaerobaculia bacterium]
MIRRLVVLMIAVLALSCESSSYEEGAPKSTASTRYTGLEIGPTPVGVIPDVLLRDNDRNKDIDLVIDYPTRGGPHPLIVFSPGFGGSHRGYVGLSSYWAANNYVVIRVNHRDRIANITKAEEVWVNATAADWKNRARDITLVLDSLESLVQRYPELEGKIDATKIGVAGHAYGSHTAMLAGGVRTFPGGVSYADPRVKAVIAMSPQGPAESRGLTSESFAELRVPAMFMTGTLDQGATESETPEWRSEGFKLAPAGDKWLVTIEGVRTATFTGRNDGLLEAIAREEDRDIGRTYVPSRRPETSPRTRTEQASVRHQQMVADIRGIALTFFDTYVRGDAAGREALEKAGTRTGVVVEKK